MKKFLLFFCCFSFFVFGMNNNAAYYQIHAVNEYGDTYCTIGNKMMEMESAECSCPQGMKEHFKQLFSQNSSNVFPQRIIGFFDENGNFNGIVKKLKDDKYKKQNLLQQIKAQLTTKPKVQRIEKYVYGFGPFVFKTRVLFYGKKNLLAHIAEDADCEDLNKFFQFFDFSECVEYKDGEFTFQDNDERFCVIQ